MKSVRHHVKEEYVHPPHAHLAAGPYQAVDRFGRKAYVGAPVGTGDEHHSHIQKGRNKNGVKKALAQNPGFDVTVHPEVKSHRGNPHFNIYNRMQG